MAGNLTFGGAESFDSWVEGSGTLSEWATAWMNNTNQALALGFDGVAGTQCLDAPVNGVLPDLEVTEDDVTVSHLTGYVRFRLRANKTITQAGNIFSFIKGSNGANGVIIRHNSSGFITCEHAEFGATVYTTTVLVPTSGDLRVEAYSHTRDGANGHWEVRINGVTVASEDDVDNSLGTGSEGQNNFALMANDDTQFDDVIWKFGSAEIDECDWYELPDQSVAVQVKRLRVVTDGSQQDWPDLHGEATAAACVTGPLMNLSAVSYDLAGATGKVTFNHETLAALDGFADGTLHIRGVCQVLWMRDDRYTDPGHGSPAAEDYLPIVHDPTTDTSYSSENQPLHIGGLARNYKYGTWETDPITTANFTRESLNAVEFGLSCPDGSGAGWTSQGRCLYHTEIYVVLAGLLPACGGVVPTSEDDESNQTDVCDVKGDTWFLDSAVRHDGRGDGVVNLKFEETGSGYDFGDTINIVADVLNVFTTADVGLKYKITNAAGTASATATVTAYSTSMLLIATLDATISDASLQDTYTTTWEQQKNVMTGLDHLEGESVGVLADGIPNYDSGETEHIVGDDASGAGTVTLDDWYGVIIAGLPYHSDLETLDLDADGLADAVRDKMKATARASILVEHTRNISIGQAATQLADYTVDTTAAATALPTKTITLPVPMRRDVPGRIFIRQEKPLPMSILGIITDVGIGGRSSR